MIKIHTDTFWDVKSKKYPLPYEESVYNKTIEIIKMVTKKGVNIEGTRILDIGCGTGIFTLPLAEKASYVIGLDNSKAMIKILKEQADKKGLRNLAIEYKSWDDVEIDTLNWKKAFDIVWASMTPAIKNARDLEKMEQCSKNWCVYIGWANRRENSFLEKAFELFGGKYVSPAGGINVNRILDEMNRKLYVEDFNDSWSWKGSTEEAIEDVMINLHMNQIKPQLDMVKTYVEKHVVNGIVSHTTFAEKRLIIWQV